MGCKDTCLNRDLQDFNDLHDVAFASLKRFIRVNR